jgi:stress response protein SCP2
MVLSLIKGQKIDLTKTNPDLNMITIGLDWQAPANMDIDVSAFLLGQDEKILNEEDFVFYGQPSSSNGSVRLEESISTIGNKHFLIELLKVPDEVQKIAFTLTIYESELKGHTFAEVSSVQLRIVNSRGQEEVAAFHINYSFTQESAIVLGELYRYKGEWKFKAEGAGFFGGLASLCDLYGVEVDNDQPVDDDHLTEVSQIHVQTNQSTNEPLPAKVNEETRGNESGHSMKDYIEIPAIVKGIDEIHSENLLSLFENSAIDGNQISLDFLRETYKTNRKNFIDMVDELALRGFRFIAEKPTNILPSHAPQLSPYIDVKEAGSRFKSVDLSRLGIAGLIQRLQVNNDLFFHKIPLCCFRFMNANIDLKDLEEEFSMAGFVIKHLDDPQEPLNDNTASMEELNSTELISPPNDTEEILGKLAINQLFAENKYKSFRKFCLWKKILLISDITPALLEEYSHTPHVGNGKVRAIEERLEELKSLGTEILTDETPDPEEPIIQVNNKYAGDKEIPQLFYDNAFNKFRLFCQEKGIKTVRQIKHKHIEAFSKRPMIGKKKVQDVLEELEQYAAATEEMVPAKFETGELFDFIKHWQVSSLLKLFGFQSISNSSLKIVDIQGADYENLEQDFDIRTLIEFSNKLCGLKLPKRIADDLPELLKVQEKSVIEGRFIQKWTLEETGQSLGVTRERIRQVEAKALKKIFNYLKINQFSLIVKLLTDSKTMIPQNELLGLIGEDHAYFIEVLKDKNSIFAYIDKLDVFCTDPEECQDFNEIDEVISDLPEQIFLNEFEQLLEEILEKVGIKEPTSEMVHRVLESYGFIRYGVLYSRGKLSIADILEQLFRKYILHPLRIDETSIELLKKLARKHFDYQLEGSVRSIDARLRDVNKLILVDSNTYQWFESENFDQSIVTLVDSYLKERFLEVNVINIDEVFKAFEEQLKAYEVTNKLHFYSIIKYFLDDEYSIGKGNTLNIYQNDKDKVEWKVTIVETIRNMGGTCSKDNLREILRVPMYRIDQAISTSDKLIPWGTNQLKLIEKIGLTTEEKEGLLALVNRSIKDGYTTVGILYKELMFDPSLAGLISKKGIDAKAKLAAVIKNLKPSLKGHINFLYEEGSHFTSFDDVVLDHFKEGATRREIQDFAKEHVYGDFMAANLIGSLLDRELFVEVDFDMLYPAHAFNIPSETIQELISLIEQQMQGKEYISLNQLKGYKRKLPAIEFRWNSFVMRSILVKHGFRQIHKMYRDYRYDKILLVKEDSKIKTFEELVYYVLKEEFEGNMHEVNVYNFLVEKGILREQEYDYEKLLPVEIKESENLISVNTIGIVSLS